MESRGEHKLISPERVALLKQFFPNINQVGGHYVTHDDMRRIIDQDKTAEFREMEKLGIVQLMDPNKSDRSWFLTDLGASQISG